MDMKHVKKVTVELEDGNKMEFNKQIVLFAEDEMSEAERALKGKEVGRLLGVIQCSPCFLAQVTEMALTQLEGKTPGLDLAVIMKHIESGISGDNSIVSVLSKLFE